MVLACLPIALGGDMVRRHRGKEATNHDPDEPQGGSANGQKVEAQSRREHAKWWLRQRAYPATSIPKGAYHVAATRWEALAKNPGPIHEKKDGPPPKPAGTWKQVGPGPLDTQSANGPPNPNWSPVAGRVAALAVDPSNASILYMGAGLGGVWKSTDKGASWKPVSDDQPALSISSIAISKGAPQTIWVGTGSGDPYAGYYGNGLMRSIDGGATWTTVGADQFVGLSISHVALDEAEGTLYVSADFGGAGNGDACTNIDLTTPGQGLFRSTDNGATWTQLLDGSIVDLEVDMSVTPRRLYVYDYFSGVHISADAGVNWFDPVGLPPKEDRIEIAIAPSDPAIVYAGVGLNNAGSLYVSTDHGATFTQVPGAPDYCEAQCYYDNVVAIAPDDPTTVYLGGATCALWKVTNASDTGGAAQSTAMSLPAGDCGQNDENWYNAYVHSDAHAYAFDPTNPKAIYFGTDGGVARTPDGGATWERLNDGVSTVQLYSVCADQTDPNILWGGSQDNGTMARLSDSSKWLGITTGDGTGCAIDAGDSSRVLMSIQYGTAYLSTDKFNQDFNYVFDTQLPDCMGLAGCGDRVSFIPPMANHPTVAGTFYIGTYRLWRSTDGGDDQTWSAISDDLTFGTGGAQCVPIGSGGEDDYISAIGPAPSDSKVIYTGSAGGMVSATFDNGKTWKTISKPPLPTRFVTGIGVDPRDPKRVYVGFSGFDATTPDAKGHVFRSTDGGETWTVGDIGMDTPVDDLIAHPTLSNVLYAGTDYGVLVSNNGGDSFTVLGDGFPRAAVYALDFRKLTSAVVASTFGRSVLELPLVPSFLASPASLSFDVEQGKKADAQKVHLENPEVYGSVVDVALSTKTPWLALAAKTATLGGGVPADIDVAVTDTQMKPGEYDGSITATPTKQGLAAATIAVHLKIAAPPTPPVPTSTPPARPDWYVAGGSCELSLTKHREGFAWAALFATSLALAARRRRH
jgi:hypothetical protein